MQNTSKKKGPVVIGGVGGSGTRVVAEILAHLGFFIGNDLNAASDNLLYTLLFKRPGWFCRNFNNTKALKTGFDLIEKIMTKRGALSLHELVFLSKACLSMSLSGHNHYGKGKGSWPLMRLKKAFSRQEVISDHHLGWGWKEPNSHLLVDFMAQHFENFKYIHTIRHGLDMSFSKNQQQLFNWHSLFDVDRPSRPDDIPSASFKYWLRANKKIIHTGKQLGPDRFLLIRFEELCTSPQTELTKIISFLDITPSSEVIDQCLAIPKKPKSVGRFRQHNLNIFDGADLDELASFGFS